MVAGLLAGCGSAPGREVDERCPEGRTSVVTVLAASSLARVFTETEPGFLAANPCVTDVVFSFGSSATLAAQVVNGAPADVFASASRTTMETVVEAGKVVGDPVVFARNEASIMVSTAYAAADRVTRVADLVDGPGRQVRSGLCTASAPCGALADRVLERAGLDRSLVADTEAASVEDLVTKIELGELDAGIVYRSDCAVTRASVRCVSVPAGQNTTTDYLAAVLQDSSAARAWLDHLASEGFRRALAGSHGFLAP